MPEIHPSPALVVTSDTPLDECVRKMRDHNAGSVLVVGYASPHPLVGIFTERDLLKRIDEIQRGNHWQKAVGTLMTRPVVTVSLYELEDAGEIMLKHGIRHLPVVYNDDRNRNFVAGVISMRDLFKLSLEGTPKAPHGRVKIGYAAADPADRQGLAAMIEQSGKAQTFELSMDRVAASDQVLPKIDFLALDLDGTGPDTWARALKRLVQERAAPRTLVLFNPDRHEKRNVSMLRKLGRSSRFASFAKPANVLAVLSQIRLWRTHS